MAGAAFKGRHARNTERHLSRNQLAAMLGAAFELGAQWEAARAKGKTAFPTAPTTTSVPETMWSKLGRCNLCPALQGEPCQNNGRSMGSAIHGFGRRRENYVEVPE